MSHEDTHEITCSFYTEQSILYINRATSPSFQFTTGRLHYAQCQSLFAPVHACSCASNTSWSPYLSDPLQKHCQHLRSKHLDYIFYNFTRSASLVSSIPQFNSITFSQGGFIKDNMYMSSRVKPGPLSWHVDLQFNPIRLFLTRFLFMNYVILHMKTHWTVTLICHRKLDAFGYILYIWPLPTTY